MKTMSPLLLTLMLAGCANAYKDAYVPAQGATPEAIASYHKGAAPAEPAVARGGPADLDALVQELAKRGYRGIGQASFTSSRQVPEFEAVEQGKRVGADLVLLLSPSFAGFSVSAALKPALGRPSSPHDFSLDPCGTTECYGSVTKSTLGEKNVYVPVRVHQANYNAIYFALVR
jgi:hypothetical protein